MLRHDDARAGRRLALAGPLCELLLGTRDATLMAYGVLGLWAFTNLEIAYALLRVEERRRAYLRASLANVLLTVALTVTLVVVLDEGARGYVLGNYAASTIVLLGLWVVACATASACRCAAARRSAPLLRFGAPTVPADAAVFALNVVDRAYLLRAESPAAAGLYAVAVKLATAVIVAVRGFQLAWPPLAYSITDDDAGAAPLRARDDVRTSSSPASSSPASTLLGRWVVRLLAAPEFFAAHEALPWVALGLGAATACSSCFVTIAGRAKVTTRTFPAALAGLAVNVVAARRCSSTPLGIAGRGHRAVRRLRGDARRRCTCSPGALFAVPFEWRAARRARSVVAGRRRGRRRAAAARRAASPAS